MKYTKKFKIRPLLYSLIFFSRRGFKNTFKPLKIADSHSDTEKRKLMKKGSRFYYPFGYNTHIERVTIEPHYSKNSNNLNVEISKIIEVTSYGKIIHEFVLDRKKSTYKYTLETNSIKEYIAFRFFFIFKNFRLWSLNLIKK